MMYVHDHSKYQTSNATCENQKISDLKYRERIYAAQKSLSEEIIRSLKIAPAGSLDHSTSKKLSKVQKRKVRKCSNFVELEVAAGLVNGLSILAYQLRKEIAEAQRSQYEFTSSSSYSSIPMLIIDASCRTLYNNKEFQICFPGLQFKVTSSHFLFLFIARRYHLFMDERIIWLCIERFSQN
jgi:hypothetical protein